jgi:hypothetical protein
MTKNYNLSVHCGHAYLSIELTMSKKMDVAGFYVKANGDYYPRFEDQPSVKINKTELAKAVALAKTL